MIFSGSRSARRRRRSCRARSPNSCSSAISASGGSVSTQAGRDRRDGDAERRVAVDEAPTSRRRAAAAALRRCRMSSSISRRPADSAAISTRPWKSRRKRASSRAGSSLRAIDAQSRRRARREVLIGQGLRQRIELDARQLDPAQRCEPLHELVGRREHFGGLENRALGVVAALLVAALRSRRTPARPRPARRVSAATIVLPGR